MISIEFILKYFSWYFWCYCFPQRSIKNGNQYWECCYFLFQLNYHQNLKEGTILYIYTNIFTKFITSIISREIFPTREMTYFNRILKKNNFLGISWCYCFPQRIIKTETNIRNVVVFYSNKTTTKIPREEQFFVICTLCLCWNWSRTLKKFNLEYLSLRIHNIWTIRLFADL